MPRCLRKLFAELSFCEPLLSCSRDHWVSGIRENVHIPTTLFCVGALDLHGLLTEPRVTLWSNLSQNFSRLTPAADFASFGVSRALLHRQKKHSDPRAIRTGLSRDSYKQMMAQDDGGLQRQNRGQPRSLSSSSARFTTSTAAQAAADRLRCPLQRIVHSFLQEP